MWFHCPHCGMRDRVPDELAGLAGRCPECQHEITFPHPDERAGRPAEPARPAAREEAIAEAPRARRPRDDDDDRPRRRARDEDDDDDRPRRRRERRSAGQYADCPHCGAPGNATKVSFTWWGGLLGPALFCHVRCNECGGCYNGKHGDDNTMRIAVYVGVSLVLAVGILIGVRLLGLLALR